MTMIKCKECGKEISSEAKTCPHCGKAVEKINLSGCLLVIIIAIVAFIFAISGNDNTPLEEDIVDEGRSAEVLEKLNKGLSSDIKKAIENIKMEVKKDNLHYDAKIYLKSIDAYPSYVLLAKVVVKQILDVLISEGRDPYKEQVKVWVFVGKRVKGATGQDMVEAFGNAHYKYSNDTIEWKNWSDNIFK